MKSLTIDDVLFDVELRPLFYDAEGMPSIENESEGEQGTLFDSESRSTHLFVPNYKAVVNTKTGHVFSVVSRGYKLVTNREAFKLAGQCFRRVFKVADLKDMRVYNVLAPKTLSFCQIDLVHKGSSFEPFAKDKWVLFLRVTNSYNRTKPLRFDMGFCRDICTNGMIFGAESITFKFLHSTGEIEKAADFDINLPSISELEKKFTEKLHQLGRFSVPREKMLAIMCKLLGIGTTTFGGLSEASTRRLLLLRADIDDLTKKYFDDLGTTGYAALNVITDIASHPEWYIAPPSLVTNMQRKATEWADEFINEIKSESFRWETYLGSFEEAAESFQKLSPVDE